MEGLLLISWMLVEVEIFGAVKSCMSHGNGFFKNWGMTNFTKKQIKENYSTKC